MENSSRINLGAVALYRKSVLWMKNYIWTFNTLVDYELVSAHWNKKRLPRHDVTYHSHTHRITKAHSNDKQRFRKSFEQTKPYSYSLIEHHHSPAFASHVRCDKKAGDERLQQHCVTYHPSPWTSLRHEYFRLHFLNNSNKCVCRTVLLSQRSQQRAVVDLPLP